LGDLMPETEVAASAPADAPADVAKPVLMPAAMKTTLPNQPAPAIEVPPSTPVASPPVASGTVVVDVEGGVVVPSFAGKALRSAIETADEAGLDLEPRGSGMAREQWPAPGTRVNRGSRVVVRFSR
jgi:cell division protein FtsI (penicillin-binding protein 3)